jgi:glycosyltransferase involved in cell wall biosynthesis
MHSNRPRICWLTPDYFMNVDAKIVPALATQYSIDWILIKPWKSQRTTDGLVPDTFAPREVRLNYRQRDPRVIMQYLSLLLSIRRGNYDLVYNSFHGLPYFYPTMSLLLNPDKLMYATHNVHTPKGSSNEWAMRTYQRYVYVVTKHFHVFSKYQLRTIAQLLPGKQHYYAPIGPDDYGPSTVQPPRDTIRLLFFGYIRRYKRLDLLLEALRTLAKAGIQNIELVVAGSCDDWEPYQQLINDQMRIEPRIGMVANKDIPDLVSSCHYLILPYQDATQSGVLSLAYHYNKPVITSDIEAFADDVIPGRTGYVFECLSHDSLVSVLKTVASRHEAVYETLTQNVREYKRQHSLEARLADYRCFLDRALESAGHRPALLREWTSV